MSPIQVPSDDFEILKIDYISFGEGDEKNRIYYRFNFKYSGRIKSMEIPLYIEILDITERPYLFMFKLLREDAEPKHRGLRELSNSFGKMGGLVRALTELELAVEIAGWNLRDAKIYDVLCKYKNVEDRGFVATHDSLKLSYEFYPPTDNIENVNTRIKKLTGLEPWNDFEWDAVKKFYDAYKRKEETEEILLTAFNFLPRINPVIWSGDEIYTLHDLEEVRTTRRTMLTSDLEKKAQLEKREIELTGKIRGSLERHGILVAA